MHHTYRKFVAIAVGIGMTFSAVAAFSAETYPPQLSDIQVVPPSFRGLPQAGLIFTNNHNYGVVEILVQVYDNYLGDFTKFHWVYTVTNHTFDPNPPTSNGFSGFELALTQFVPDINDITAPNAAWILNCCSGQPVEWDITNSAGPGVMPNNVGVFSFTTLPRLITISPGWFHTWQGDGQTDVINYPAGDGPESPDLQDTTPQVELCCFRDATGAIVCQPVPLGTCITRPEARIVATCADCETVGVESSTWGAVKKIFD